MGGPNPICFTFTITDDECVENKESFEVILSSSDPYVIFHTYEAIVTIWDNDCEWSDEFVCVAFELNHFSSNPAVDAIFGVEMNPYSVDENAGLVTLCALLEDGCLERELSVQYGLFDKTAQSMFCQNLLQL